MKKDGSPTFRSLSGRTILQMLVNQIRTEYVAGCYLERPPGTRKPHRVEVRLASKDKGRITGGVRTVLY